MNDKPKMMEAVMLNDNNRAHIYDGFRQRGIKDPQEIIAIIEYGCEQLRKAMGGIADELIRYASQHCAGDDNDRQARIAAFTVWSSVLTSVLAYEFQHYPPSLRARIFDAIAEVSTRQPPEKGQHQ